MLCTGSSLATQPLLTSPFTALPPLADRRSSPNLVHQRSVVILIPPPTSLVINPTLLSLPRYLVALLLASSFRLCWSPIFGGQLLPCSCSSWVPPPAPARDSQCSLQTSPCPLQNNGACWAYLLLCSLLFQLSSNCGIVPRFVIRLRSWANFPGVPHWKCLKNESS